MNKLVGKDAEQQAARKARDGRNVAIGLGLAAFVILVFVVTLVRLTGNVHPHP